MPVAATIESVVERFTDRFYGKYRGTVSDNQDPLKRGRLQATVPEVLDTTPTGWALPCAPYVGPGNGLFLVPPVGAPVWIEFEAGDVSRPIWTGGWWGSGDVPNDASGSPSQTTTKILRSEQGLLLELDDAAQKITLGDANGTNLLTIDVNAGNLEIKSATKSISEAPQILHGENAAHPHVFGDNLSTYLNQLVSMFNAHMHPGEVAIVPVTPAPPVPTFPPPDPSLLSTKVMVE
jgi:hypothetical protein